MFARWILSFFLAVFALVTLSNALAVSHVARADPSRLDIGPIPAACNCTVLSLSRGNETIYNPSLMCNTDVKSSLFDCIKCRVKEGDALNTTSKMVIQTALDFYGPLCREPILTVDGVVSSSSRLRVAGISGGISFIVAVLVSLAMV